MQSDLIGQRMQVSNLAWALPQTGKSQRRVAYGLTSTGVGSLTSLRHPFLPANYPVVDFLCDLLRVIPQAPVFARGIFTCIPLSFPVDARIKPEQVFEHLIEARQAYGFKVCDNPPPPHYKLFRPLILVSARAFQHMLDSVSAVSPRLAPSLALLMMATLQHIISLILPVVKVIHPRQLPRKQKLDPQEVHLNWTCQVGVK